MLALKTNGRYEGVCTRGTFVSVASGRLEDDAYNRAVTMDPHTPFAERLETAMTHILQHPDIYRTRNNGYSVIVRSNSAREGTR